MFALIRRAPGPRDQELSHNLWEVRAAGNFRRSGYVVALLSRAISSAIVLVFKGNEKPGRDLIIAPQPTHGRKSTIEGRYVAYAPKIF